MNLNWLLANTVWNTVFELSPAGADSPASGDDKIRELKSATRERLAKEHKMDLSTGTASADGWHIQGSAIDYYQASAPTTRPDGTTALDANDYGRRWYNTSTGVESIYTSGGWGVFANTNWQGQIVCITSGSGNWTVPGGVHKIRVKCVGGGGGGGGPSSNGGGGGGGGTLICDVLAEYISVIPGASLAYSVGAGGSAGGPGTSGGTGGATSFAEATTRAGGNPGGSAYANVTGALIPGYGGSGVGVCGSSGQSGGEADHAGGGSAGFGPGGSGGGAGGLGAQLVAPSTWANATVGGYGGGGGGGNYGGAAAAGGSGIIIIEY